MLAQVGLPPNQVPWTRPGLAAAPASAYPWRQVARTLRAVPRRYPEGDRRRLVDGTHARAIVGRAAPHPRRRPRPRRAEKGLRGRARRCASTRSSSAKYLPDDAPERNILYEDPELGFCILGHVYHGAKESTPHDHGPTWAIYGQAAGETIMSDWEMVSPPRKWRAGQGAAGPRIHADPGIGLCLQRGRSAFAAARRLDPADPDRRPQRREDQPLPYEVA